MSALLIRSTLSIASLISILASSCPAEQADVAAQLQTATHSTGKQQYKAIDALGQRHEAATTVVPKLRQLLTSKDPQVRWRTARALGDYGALAKDAAGDLRKLLTDSDPIVQYHAAGALGKLEDRSDETTLALIHAATSKDARVAREAIAALRNLRPGPERVVKALSEALKSNDKSVTVYALEAVVELGPKAVPLLNEALKRPETAYLACSAIEQIGPKASDTVPAIVELLGSTKHSQLQIQALLALAAIGPTAEPAVPKIVPLLDSPHDKTVPVAAAYALGSIGAKDADEQLRRALEKDNPFLQMIAAWALAKGHPDDQNALRLAVDKLVKGLKNKDATMRIAAAKSLQSLHAPFELVASALVEVANDPDPEVQTNVVEAVASLGESVVPRTAKALQNSTLRGPAIKVLTKLGPKAAAAVEPLIEANAGADSHVRMQINFAFAAIGPKAAPATETLVKAIYDKDRGVRESALYALREIGPGAKAAVRPLVRRAEADHSFDSLAAAWAVSRIAPEDSKVGARMLPILTRGLSNSDEQTRLNSTEAIAAWGSDAASAATELKKVAHDDSSPAVRAAAEAALKRIGTPQ